jgi:hypothetical protein
VYIEDLFDFLKDMDLEFLVIKEKEIKSIWTLLSTVYIYDLRIHENIIFVVEKAFNRIYSSKCTRQLKKCILKIILI